MHALKVLDFESVLAKLIRHCETGLGEELTLALEPSFDEDEVWDALELTRQAYELMGSQSAPSLARVSDHRKSLVRAEKGGTLGGQELFEIGELLAALRQMAVFLSGRKDDLPGLYELTLNFPNVPKLENALFDSLEPDGEVKDSASQTLGSIRKRKSSASSKVLERIQSYVSGKARDYLSDPIYTVRDGRYVLPVKSEHRGKVKGIVHDSSSTGHTVYIEPEDVLQLGNQLRELEGLEREEIQKILGELSALVGTVAAQAAESIEDAAQLDLALAKARLAYEMEARLPTRSGVARIRVDGGRHPLLDPKSVVPVSIEVGFSANGLLITGPNTGGKTVAMKCVGLFVLMAQSGLALPARDVEYGFFSQVWADIGDEQSISQSLSTFSGHIRNISEALKKLSPNSLVLFDEIGAGTDPAEGASLARALLRRFAKGGARIIASTHYGELKAFAYSEPGFQNAAMEFDSKSLKPTYRLLMGAPGASHALRIAERYGMPKDVLEDAQIELGEQHQDIANMLHELEEAQKRARQAQSQADKKTAELRELEAKAKQKLEEAEEIRRTVNQEAKDAIEDTLREIRLQASDIFEEIKSGAPKSVERAREDLKALQSVGDELAQKYESPVRKPDRAPKLQKGMNVRVDGYSQIGVLLDEPTKPQVQVQMGPLKLMVKLNQLSPSEAKPEIKIKPKANLSLQKAQTAVREVSLRGMRAEDAEDELIRFLDDAVLGNLHQVRIVHGKGEGILRKLSQDLCKRHKGVASYRDAEPAEGGGGVTIAILK